MSNPMFPVPKEAQSRGASDVKWFAGVAMHAILGKQASIPDSDSAREEIALWSYRMAQAMVAMERRIHADNDK